MVKVIYFLEDDESINTLIDVTLKKNGFDAYGFYEPLSFIGKLAKSKPDLIVLDLMLPNISGFDVLKMLKEKKEYDMIPVIILSAKSDEKDIVKGLDMGASDYITKPFGLNEFISRINANLRKVNMHMGKVLKVRDLSIDTLKHLVYYKDEVIDEITSKEYEVLLMLLESPSIVVPRGKLLKSVWGYDPLAVTRTLDMHIKTIREKIARYTDEEYIETIRGVGFIIRE